MALEIHDGSMLTAARDKCRIQFDRPKLGVAFVKDVDCMPLNLLDNMHEALRRESMALPGRNEPTQVIPPLKVFISRKLKNIAAAKYKNAGTRWNPRDSFLSIHPVDKSAALTYIDDRGNWHKTSKGAPEQDNVTKQASMELVM
ncbi:hypothetical protein CTI12_AA614940 [Artemisia annua]|uniref:Uncharacterized protein n=1 Tax=Artemisia annua TaxID=35608 RepID=A0A2U1KDZ4_ARTAN|nr:hypothetical protein CTI12_AA614940 [Artemisia annua]